MKVFLPPKPGQQEGAQSCHDCLQARRNQECCWVDRKQLVPTWLAEPCSSTLVDSDRDNSDMKVQGPGT